MLLTVCTGTAAHLMHTPALHPSLTYPILSLLCRLGAQNTNPAQLLSSPLLYGNSSFDLCFACATCAMIVRIFPSEQLVGEKRVPLNVRLGICLQLFTVMSKCFE